MTKKKLVEFIGRIQDGGAETLVKDYALLLDAATNDGAKEVELVIHTSSDMSKQRKKSFKYKQLKKYSKTKKKYIFFLF